MFVDKALGYCAYNGLFYKFRIVNRARWDLFLLLHWFNEGNTQSLIIKFTLIAISFR